jgi:hypothetical protein
MQSRLWRLGLGLGWAVLGIVCSCRPMNVTTAFPMGDGSEKTALLVVEAGADSIIEAIDLNDRNKVVHLKIPMSASRLTMVLYHEPINDFRFGAGVQQIVADDGTNSIPFVAGTDEAFTSSISDGRLQTWVRAPHLSGLAATFHFKQAPLDPSYCMKLDLDTVDSTQVPITFVLPLGDDHQSVAVAKEDGTLVRATCGTSASLAPLVPGASAGSMPFTAGFAGDDGTLWMARADGQLYRLALPYNRLEAVTSAGSDRITAMDGARGAAPFEVFLSSEGGLLERYDGKQMTVIRSSTMAIAGGDHRSLVWVGSGSAIVNGSTRMLPHVFTRVSGSGVTAAPCTVDDATVCGGTGSTPCYCGLSTHINELLRASSGGALAIGVFGAALPIGFVDSLAEDGTLRRDSFWTDAQPWVALHYRAGYLVAGAKGIILQGQGDGDHNVGGCIVQRLPETGTSIFWVQLVAIEGGWFIAGYDGAQKTYPMGWLTELPHGR